MKQIKHLGILSAIIISAIVFAFGIMLSFGAPAKRPQNAVLAQDAGIGENLQHKEYTSVTDGDFDSETNTYYIGSSDSINTIVREYASMPGYTFILINDIDMSNFDNWVSLPYLAQDSIFDGNNYTINNLEDSSARDCRGLFASVEGTVQDLVMNNVSITYNDKVGAVAGQVSGEQAVFKNVIVKSGTINASHDAGGIIGYIDSQTKGLEMEGCYNGAKINGNYYLGGIIGGSASVTTNDGYEDSYVKIKNCANEGIIKAASSYVGGIIGNSYNLNLNVEYCYNTGHIISTTYGSAGIVYISHSQNSTVKIESCFNNSVIETQGAAAAIVYNGDSDTGTSNITVSNCWFNRDLLLAGSGLSLGVAPIINGGGSKTTVQMQSQDFVNQMNSNYSVGDIPPFRLTETSVTLYALLPGAAYFFSGGIAGGWGVPIYKNGIDVSTTLPAYTETGLTVPVGYTFLNWAIFGTDGTTIIAEYNGSEAFANPDGQTYIEFVAQFEKINYTVVCDSLPDGVNFSAESASDFIIGGDGVLKLDGWANGYVWQVKLSGQSGSSDLDWIQVSDLQSLDLGNLIDASFLQTYVDNTTITFRVTDTTATRILNIIADKPEACQSLEIGINDDDVQNVNFGIMSFRGDVITVNTIIVSTKDYYHFDKIEIISDGTTVHTFSESQIEGADLSLGLDNTIKLYFSKVQYTFDVSAETKDGTTSAALNSKPSVDSSNANVVAIGDPVKFSASAAYQIADGDNNYRFAAWKIKTYDGLGVSSFVYASTGITLYNLNLAGSSIDADWLSKYVGSDGKISLLAEYAPAYAVNISMLNSDNPSDINCAALDVAVFDAITLQTTHYGSLLNEILPSGSTVTITVNTGDMYNFKGFDLGPFAGDTTVQESSQAIIDIYKGGIIMLDFEYRSFDVTVLAKDKNSGGVLKNVGTLDAAKTAKVNDKIILKDFIANNGYQFHHFEVNAISGAVLTLQKGAELDLDEMFLKSNLNARQEFVVTAVFERTYQLDISVAAGSQGMGTFTVKRANNVVLINPDSKGEYWLTAGMEVTVTATPANEFFAFSDFTGYDTEVNQLALTMNTKLKVIVNFTANEIKFNQDLKTSGGGSVTADKTNGTIGKTIVLIADVPAGNDIKKWEIGGKNVKDLDNVVVENNTATITLTSDWVASLSGNMTEGYTLESKVTYGMSDSITMMILIPAVVIPILIIIMVINYLNLQKKKRVIKAQLVAESHAKATLGVGGFIEDLRQGKNVGEITKEDVKKAMQEEKNKKK